MAKRSGWFYARVSVLSVILVVVIAYAWHDVHSRRARKTWDHTLAIAIVLLRSKASAGAVDAASIDGMRLRAPALGDRLESELHRFRPGAPRPFAFTVFGPIDVNGPPPPPTGDGVVDLARHAWDLHAFVSDIDDRAGVVAGAYDSRIYVTLGPASHQSRKMVEGSSEQGGRVGSVSVELGAAGAGEDEVPASAMVDFALSVIAHELLHTLDATDKYDEVGRARVPDGLAEPALSPRYPQRFVEIMARGRPVSAGAGDERTLDSLDELAVGDATAREIGWLQPSP